MTIVANWNGIELARSDNTVIVEGNHYFPPEDVRFEYFKSSELHTISPWKGEASYHNIVVDGNENHDAAWFYPSPKVAAADIKDRIAFWRGVEVHEE